MFPVYGVTHVPGCSHRTANPVRPSVVFRPSGPCPRCAEDDRQNHEEHYRRYVGSLRSAAAHVEVQSVSLRNLARRIDHKVRDAKDTQTDDADSTAPTELFGP